MTRDHTLEAQDLADARAAVAALPPSAQAAPSPAPAPRHRYRTLLLWLALVVGFVWLYQGTRSEAARVPQARASSVLEQVAGPLVGAGWLLVVLAVWWARRGRVRAAPQRPRLAAGGLEFVSPGRVHQTSWGSIGRVEQTPKGLLVEVPGEGWLILPSRAFDPGEEERFLEGLRARTGAPSSPSRSAATTVDFELQPAEVLDASRAMQRRGPRRLAVQLALSGSLLASVSALFLAVTSSSLWSVVVLVPSAVFSLFAVRGLRKPGLSASQQARYRGVCFSVEFDDRHFRFAGQTGSTTLEWSAVLGAADAESLFLLWDDTATYFVPKRAFASPEDLAAFRQRLDQVSQRVSGKTT